MSSEYLMISTKLIKSALINKYIVLVTINNVVAEKKYHVKAPQKLLQDLNFFYSDKWFQAADLINFEKDE